MERRNKQILQNQIQPNEIRVVTADWNLRIAVGMILAALILGLSVIYRFEVGLFLITSGALLVTYIGGRMVIATYFRVAKYRLERQILQTEVDRGVAEVQTMIRNQQFFVLSPGERCIVPAGMAFEVIDGQQLSARGATSVAPLLSGPAVDEPYSVVRVFSQTGQGYGIVGGQYVGKTRVAIEVAMSWQRKGSEVYVIGCKTREGEYPGCTIYRGGPDTMEAGLKRMLDIASARHEANENADSFPPILVILDDWMYTHRIAPIAHDFVMHATTVLVSANVIPLFILHSDTRDAWGVSAKGSSLKDAFCKLWLRPRVINGIRLKEEPDAWITLPHETDEIPAKLPESYSQGAPKEVITLDRAISMNSIEGLPSLTEKAQKVIDLWESGVTDIPTITKQVYGQMGGKQVELVKRTINTYTENPD